MPATSASHCSTVRTVAAGAFVPQEPFDQALVARSGAQRLSKPGAGPGMRSGYDPAIPARIGPISTRQRPGPDKSRTRIVPVLSLSSSFSAAARRPAANSHCGPRSSSPRPRFPVRRVASAPRACRVVAPPPAIARRRAVRSAARISAFIDTPPKTRGGSLVPARATTKLGLAALTCCLVGRMRGLLGWRIVVNPEIANATPHYR
jgi:hypothetical protein